MAKINGVEVPTILIKGKEYPTVATRVQVAHKGNVKTGFSMVGWEIVSVKERDFVKVVLQVGDGFFHGTAEIHWNAPANTADGSNPVETAETSAVGRALAFAGLIIDTIASADEMIRAGHTFVESEPPNASELKMRGEKLGIAGDAWKVNVCQATGKSEDEARKGLTIADRWAIKKRLDLIENSSQRLLEQKTQHDGHMETLHAALAANPAD